MKETVPRIALKLADCAARISVSTEQVKRWIDAGHLAAFVSPGVDRDSTRPGPKTLRVWSDDWDRFTHSHTRTAEQSISTNQADKAPTLAEAGRDGKTRRRRRRSG